MLLTFRPIAVACALCAASAATLGAEVVVDFDEIPQGTYFENVISHGFRLSPYCHIDIFAGPFASNGSAMGWDNSGCNGGNPTNASYLGQSPSPGFSSVFVDYFDHPFTLESFFLDIQINGNGGSVLSSKGGQLSFSQLASGQLVSVAGPKWSGIDWIQFTSPDIGNPLFYVDSMTFRVALPVPEPETYAMFALGLGVVAFVARRSRTYKSDDHAAAK